MNIFCNFIDTAIHNKDKNNKNIDCKFIYDLLQR